MNLLMQNVYVKNCEYYIFGSPIVCYDDPIEFYPPYILQWFSHQSKNIRREYYHSEVKYIICIRIKVIVLKATFNNLSTISWWWVLFVEETGVPEENHRPTTSHWQTLSYNVSSIPRHEAGFDLTTLAVIGIELCYLVN
jgi:hypothetical protein